MSQRRSWVWLILGVAVVLLAGFILWAESGPAPLAQAQAALQSDGSVTVSRTSWWAFLPASGEPRVGLILYPGGRVDARAYAPAARAIARHGFLVTIVPMPLDLAFFDLDAAREVISAHPEIDRWAVGGHSLGGAMAARFAHRNPDLISGLVLWAAYPAESDDLSERDLRVTSISASADGLATPDEIAASRTLLPPETRWVVVEGGNHAQFGWYGDQAGDNPARVSRAEQEAQVVSATVDLLDALGEGGQP